MPRATPYSVMRRSTCPPKLFDRTEVATMNRILQYFLLALLTTTVVFAAPLESWAESPPPGNDDGAEPRATGETGDTTDELPIPGEQAAEDVPSVAFGELEPGLERAGEELEANFSHFLDRQPLGFDTDLFDLVSRDLESLYQTGIEALVDPAAVEPADFVDLVLILITLALFLVAFLLMDRQFTYLAHRLQARTHFDVSAWLTTAIRKLILVVGRSTALLVLIGLSLFPVRAIAGDVGWAHLLTDALFVFLVYRIVKTLLVAALRLHPRDQSVQQHFARLEQFGMWVLRLTVGFVLLLAALEHFDYHEQAYGFVSFCFRVALAIVPLYLFTTREAVLSLLPPRSSSRLYRAFHRAVDSNYYALLTLTVILLALNAAGYVNAATFLLVRGYALLVIGAIWFATLERLHHYVITRARQAEEADETPSPLLAALEQWLVAVGSLIIIIITLHIIGLYAPVMALIETPIVAIGRVEISLLNLINVVFIVVATVLSIRLFKALLNAKIYPAFGVDIGIAYAVNTLINYALIVIAFILCLVALGVQLSAVMVVLASLGVGIGFGLQNIAENLVSGFILLFGRAVEKGDFITVNDLYGRVEAVGARSVVVRTPDNFSMLIPSKEIVSGRIVNWTFQDSIVRIHIPVGVSYDSEPAEVREILLETADAHPDILEEPEPDVWIVEFGDSSIQFELLVYFDCRDTNERALQGKFNFLVWRALADSGVDIPFPQRDLHLRSLGDLDRSGDTANGDGGSGDDD